ncbi:ketoacyl-ACP synthase III family protein [Micromonospora lupini]|uniref:Putative 3-oxoacyl-ACP synthase III n=1 Tax=Micromonospora lupini str. Lupac 08 TaxID=1150864 RepID=I0KW07_9ACTN|nr:ketoacyl-ACP synthase III family protein [Micromonospora lupini]CCH15754.1 Putative 3-oxoacyl-ACP synthase III [Micromonospora lupini str. Lupac 08]
MNAVGLVAGVWYPSVRQTVAAAVACGDVRAKTATELGYTELPVSVDVAPPDMAVRAARPVLDRGRVPAGDLAMVLHASVHHQGHDAWSAPHYIAHQLAADRAVPIGLLQQCNGGAIGIELAIDRLRGDPRSGPVLVTTADRFLTPSWHRWLTDYGMATGDGATAVLVHRGDRPSDLLLHASATTVAADLEVMHRGDDGLDAHPLGHGPQIDVKRTKRAFIAAYGVDRFIKTAYDRISEAVATALAEAGLSRSDLRYAVLPRLGTKAMAEAYVPPLVEQVDADLLDLGRATGHLGAGDLNANLADLGRGDWLGPGDHALVLNGGGGFTFTAMVVSRPDSPSSTARGAFR